MSSESHPSNPLAPVISTDHARGPAAAVVTLLTYGDYQCPFSALSNRVNKRLAEHFRKELRFVFRHFPLVNKHRNALLAAQAVEAGAAQGKFWELHDYLFENQFNLDEDGLLDAARALKLDEARVARELSGQIHLPRVKLDMSTGNLSGVTGTPTHFINGKLHEEDDDFETLWQTIKKAAKV